MRRIVILLVLVLGGCGQAGQSIEPTARPAPTEALAGTAKGLPARSAVGATPPLQVSTAPSTPGAEASYPPPTAYPPPETPTPAPPTTLAPTPAAAECVPPDQIPPPSEIAPTTPISRTASGPIPVFGFRVLNSYPHDRGAFTEGLQYVAGQLYESTGLNGQSELRRVDLASGAVMQRCALGAQAFGEGITVLGDAIYQLTWKNQAGFVYDRASFALRRSFSYVGEGWGLTNDGQRLVMSDGSATLRFLDPATLEELGRVEVYDDRGPVTRLNELEFVDGQVYANIWQTDRIARIDPASGAVTGWIDLAGLLGPEDRTQPVDVLNGIAYDADGRRLFVTGKLWPKLFEIALVPAQ